MATLNKNFRIKHGLIVEGTSGTINGQNILTETGSDQYILDLVGGENLIDSVASGLSVDVNSQLSIDRTVVDGWYDSNGAAAAAQIAAEDYADGLAVNYDAAGAAAAAQNAAEDYADGLAVNYDAAGAAAAAQNAAEDYADGLASNYDPAGSSLAAQNAAEDYADGLISTEVTNRNNAISTAKGEAIADAGDYTDLQLEDYTPTNSLDATIDGYGYLKSADLSGYATESYVGTAIDNLVDGAPALLNTLNELAAAINDDANYTTTITTALGTKAPLASPDLTGVPTAPTAAANTNTTQIATTAFAKAEADAAQTAAEGYADSLASNYDAAGAAAAAQTAAEGTAQEALDDVLDGTTAFTAINLNSVSKQQAAQSTIATAQNGSSMMSWAKSDYGTAKAWVKFATATHSQISEVLLTSDSTGNISITEFGMVGTNGSLGSVGASYLNGNIAIEVDTVHAATTVTVVATLIK